MLFQLLSEDKEIASTWRRIALKKILNLSIHQNV